jgi:ubiquinone/menaquinone biosynthesis C-methylase UbiE
MTNTKRTEIDNVFSADGVEFEKWANIEDINPEEKYIIEKYFDRDPQKSTVEAGTGGGRILLEMYKMGFRNLTGFDYIPEMIKVANQRKGDLDITFNVEDATKLSYPDASFDRAFYSQQILSLMPDTVGRLSSFQEASRIVKSGGIVVFALLCLDARMQKSIYLPYIAYLNLFRKITGSSQDRQYIPWLIHHGKFNWPALADRGDRTYWYKVEEIYKICEQIGIKVLSLGTRVQIQKDKMCESKAEILSEKMEGALYVVCRKD